MKILKPIITSVILILSLFYLNNNIAYAYTESDCVISNVRIEEENNDKYYCYCNKS